MSPFPFFGVMYQGQNSGGSTTTTSIDSIPITVTFTAGAPPTTYAAALIFPLPLLAGLVLPAAGRLCGL